MDSVIIVGEVVAWYRQGEWNLSSTWVIRVKKLALPHSVIKWGLSRGEMAITCFIPVVPGVGLGALAGWEVGGKRAWGASFLLYCFTKFLPEEAAWGNRVAISSDRSYLQVTENPSQSVLYKCLSILILFSHITRNPEVVWCLFSSADQSNTRRLVSMYLLHHA